MDTHKNAPLTPKGREAMVRSVIEGGLTKAAAALQFNVTAKTVAKWVKRFGAEGVDGLRDRSSRPHSLPNPACHVRRRRDVAPAALHRQADRGRGRHLSGASWVGADGLLKGAVLTGNALVEWDGPKSIFLATPPLTAHPEGWR